MALAVFLGSLSLLFLALAGAILIVVYQFTHAGGNLTSGVGNTLQTAGQAVTQSAQSAVQSVSDSVDPLHPPRYPIVQDPEFDELRSIAAGDNIGDSRLFHFAVVAVEQRSEGGAPAELVYARIHRRLIVPDVTKILGVTIRTDDQPKDYALYRGQEFGLGGHAYKVNWLSIENQTIEVVRFRQASDAEGPLVFDEQ
ncbi:MAG TPA: hypothetical protein VKT80_19310 [Chloroflexota bacterium]|nr:hypothetical protein [Chloroflexota bacterium]